MSEKKKTGPKSRGGMGNKYRYAKGFNVPKNFPNDTASAKEREILFRANGHGWGVKYRVDACNIPHYWVVSKKLKVKGTVLT